MNMTKKINKINKEDIMKRIKGFEMEDPRTVEPKQPKYYQCSHDKGKYNILWKSGLSKVNRQMETLCKTCNCSLGFVNPLGIRDVYYKKEDDFFKWLFGIKRTEEPYWSQKKYIVKYT